MADRPAGGDKSYRVVRDTGPGYAAHVRDAHVTVSVVVEGGTKVTLIAEECSVGLLEEAITRLAIDAARVVDQALRIRYGPVAE